MRLLLLLLLICPLLTFSAAAQVDTLRHKSSIEAYVKAKGSYAAVELLEVNQVFRDSVLVSAVVPAYWLRADFNHDGVEDMLVRADVRRQPTSFSHDLFLVLTGGLNPELVQLDNGYYHRFHMFDIPERVVAPITIAQRTYLVYSLMLTRINKPVRRFTQDTICVQAGRAMLYTAHPLPASPIKSVHYTLESLRGIHFRLRIQPGNRGVYGSKAHATPIQHRSHRFSPTEQRYLTNLLGHLRLPQLADHYAVSWEDDNGCLLTVTWADGQTKSISDYGLQGTYGLGLLYQFLWRLHQPPDLREP